MNELERLPPSERSEESLRWIAHAVYALQALGFFTLVTPLAGVVLNYVKLEDAAGSEYEAHFRWQIRTFWWMLGWCVLGVATWLLLVGMAILLAASVWYIYRIVKGWLRLVERRPV